MQLHHHIRSAAPASMLALFLLGCASGGSSGVLPVESLEYAPALEIDFSRMTRDASGLYYQDLEVGDGLEARRGEKVTVHFSGWLPDGSLFDSSREAGTPVSFTIGEREVIRGWEEGVQGMRVGGRRKLVVPPRLGYGSQPRGDRIPGNATLVFVVELLEVEW